MRAWGAVLVAILAARGVAAADPQPWAVGVTDEQKARARQALDEGNALFLEKRYVEALARYEQAIAAWDHPAIRFNIVRCQIQLDRIVEAADSLKRALAYGAAPLDPAIYQEALSYEKLLANQIGELAITCAQPGVRVTLDGQPLASCPARVERRVKPGPHQIVGVKPGLLTSSVDVVVVGGTRRAIAVELAPPSATARIEHRWPTWIPWAVFGGGLAVIATGAIVDVNAASRLDSYERVVDQSCSPAACTPAQIDELEGIRRSAERQSRIGVGMMVAGGAIAAAGGVLLYLNRGRTVYARERLVPAVAPGAGGATLSLVGRW